MSSTLYISPLIQPKGKDMNGIFSYYINQSINPLTHFVTVEASGSYENLDQNSVITWRNGGKWASETKKGASISFRFYRNAVYMTHFSFIGYPTYIFATIFNLYGLGYNDNGKESWTLIQTFDYKDFCGIEKNLKNNLACKEGNIETWEVKSPSFYHGYKWEEVSSSDPDIHRISMRGIDIFGKINAYYLCKLFSFRKKYKLQYFVSILLFISSIFK